MFISRNKFSRNQSTCNELSYAIACTVLVSTSMVANENLLLLTISEPLMVNSSLLKKIEGLPIARYSQHLSSEHHTICHQSQTNSKHHVPPCETKRRRQHNINAGFTNKSDRVKLDYPESSSSKRQHPNGRVEVLTVQDVNLEVQHARPAPRRRLGFGLGAPLWCGLGCCSQAVVL